MKTRIVLFALLTACFALSGCKKGSKDKDEPADTTGDQTAKDPVVTPEPTKTTEPEKVDLGGPSTGVFLWQVDGPKGPSYLFGTIHVGVDAKKDLPEVVWTKLEQATTFAMEADLSKINAMEMMSNALIKDGKTLDQQLAPGQFDLLTETLDMEPAVVKTFQPWYATMMMGLKAFTGMGSLIPMDMALEDTAKKADKKLVYLEEASYQMDLLMKLMTAEALGESLDSMVEEGMDTAEKIRAFAVEMVGAYKRGDVEYDFAKELTPTDESFTQKLILDRNKNWIPAIAKMLEAGGAFIAVGTGHLLGDGNVRELLEKKGYKITRVEAK